MENNLEELEVEHPFCICRGCPCHTDSSGLQGCTKNLCEYTTSDEARPGPDCQRYTI